MKKRIKYGIIIGLALVIIFSVSMTTILGMQDRDLSSDTNSIKQLINDTEKMETNISLMPAAYNSSLNKIVPDNLINIYNDKVVSEAEKYYSSKSGILADRIRVLQGAVIAQGKSANDCRIINRNIEDLKFLTIDIKDNSATVITNMTIKAKILSLVPAQNGDKTENNEKKLLTTNPSQEMRYYYNLEKENGSWKITNREGIPLEDLYVQN